MPNPEVDFRININRDFLGKAKQLSNTKLKRIARAIRDESKRLVPVDTGALKKSIAVVEYADKEGVVSIETQTGYGGYVEEGTSKMRAQPFMRPAAETVRGFIERDQLP